MSNRIATKDASWWRAGGAQSSRHDGRGFMFGGGIAGNQFPAIAGFKLQDLPSLHLTAAMTPSSHYLEQQNGCPEMVQLRISVLQPLSRPCPPSSRTRLRWTKELHEQFVSVVDQLGGANNATPKTIWNKMRVEGITLFQIKSHLQKYRRGKAARKLLKTDVVAPTGRRNVGDELPEKKPINMDVTSYAFGDGTLEGQKYGNILNHPVETIVKNSGMMEYPPPLTASKLEKSIAEWYGLYNGDNMKPIVPHLNSSMDDYLFRSSMFGSLFNEVGRFAKIEDFLMRDDGAMAMDAPAQLNNNFN